MGLNARVNGTVGYQALPIGECLWTIQTCERLFARMTPLVDLQLPFPMKSLWAKFTQQFFLAFVYPQMIIARMFARENFVTDMTGVKRTLIVTVIVFVKI